MDELSIRPLRAGDGAIAGEIFFKNLQNLMGRNDSHELADILEVYYLCMLLGFAGRYSLGGKGDLYAIQQQTGDKIQRIRQTPPQLLEQQSTSTCHFSTSVVMVWVFRGIRQRGQRAMALFLQG